MNEVQNLIRQQIAAAISKPRSSSRPPSTSVPAASNPAIAYCLQAYTEALQASLHNGDSSVSAKVAGEAAYRVAMPPLSGSRNIRDFVACVGHGMTIQAIEGAEAARLLYAAQVASTAQSTQRLIKAKSHAITAPKTPQNPNLPNIDLPPNPSTVS